MSHTSTVQAAMTDGAAVADACKAMGLAPPTAETAYRLYDGSTHAGLGVRLPGWNFPVIVKTDGTLAYDNYGGSWGKPAELNRFRQQYQLAVARRVYGHNHRFNVTQRADGALVVEMER